MKRWTTGNFYDDFEYIDYDQAALIDAQYGRKLERETKVFTVGNTSPMQQL